MADIDAPDLRPFIMLYTDVLKDIGDPTAIALYCALLSYANREKLCHPSLKKLAKDIGLSGESTKQSDAQSTFSRARATSLLSGGEEPR